MSQSQPDTVEHLDEQPWYDYRECLDATLFEDRDRSIGEIFLVKIATNQKDGPVYHMFWALKIAEGGPDEDRYRMCLYKTPLEHQRTLRGMESPLQLRRVVTRFGTPVYRLTSGVKDCRKRPNRQIPPAL